jgi:hypothetical protein
VRDDPLSAHAAHHASLLVLLVNAVTVGLGGLYATTQSIIVTIVTASLVAMLGAVSYGWQASAACSALAPHVRMWTCLHAPLISMHYLHWWKGKDVGVASTGFDEFFRREHTLLIGFLQKSGFKREDAEEAAGEAMAYAYADWSDPNPRVTT